MFLIISDSRFESSYHAAASGDVELLFRRPPHNQTLRSWPRWPLQETEADIRGIGVLILVIVGVVVDHGLDSQPIVAVTRQRCGGRISRPYPLLARIDKELIDRAESRT